MIRELRGCNLPQKIVYYITDYHGKGVKVWAVDAVINQKNNLAFAKIPRVNGVFFY